MTRGQIVDRILRADPLLSPTHARGRPSPVPAEQGVYAFFLSGLPGRVPTAACAHRGDFALVYLGIAPSRPDSGSTLRKRLRRHLRGNASGSTLRLTLGCLLADELRISLAPTGASGRLTFGPGESVLSEWIDEHARITWIVTPEPWTAEQQLIADLSLPLNLEFNAPHPFHATLSGLRREARARARARRSDP